MMPPQIYLTGRIRSGKDFVADATGIPKTGMSVAIRMIVRHFHGAYGDTSDPGYRTVLQQIGQWGWGLVDAQYPITVDRLLFAEKIRRSGRNIYGMNHVPFSRFGLDKDFWVQAMLALPPAHRPNPKDIGTGVIVTGVRHYHEVPRLREKGYVHYHVMCSEETRRKRLESLGEPWDYHTQADKDWSQADESERQNIALSRLIMGDHLLSFQHPEHPLPPDDRVVWSDDKEPIPEGREFLTIEAFVNKLKEEPKDEHERDSD